MSQLGMGVMLGLLSGSQRETVATLERAIGKKIKEVKLNLGGTSYAGDDATHDTISIETEEGQLFLVWDGGQSCCEHRYVTTDADLPSYVGKTILDFEVRDMPVGGDPDDLDVHEQQTFVIVTSEGNIDFVTHNEHNGYYGGFCLDALEVGKSDE